MFRWTGDATDRHGDLRRCPEDTSEVGELVDICVDYNSGILDSNTARFQITAILCFMTDLQTMEVVPQLGRSMGVVKGIPFLGETVDLVALCPDSVPSSPHHSVLGPDWPGDSFPGNTK